MKMTAARQRNAVSEGMALGLVAEGYNRLDFDEARVDGAFESAWQTWAYRSRFRQVETDMGQRMGAVPMMTHAYRAKQTPCFYWTRHGELRIFCRRDDFDPSSVVQLEAAASMIGGEVPLAGWKALAQSYLDSLRLSEPGPQPSVSSNLAPGPGRDSEEVPV